MRNLTLTTDAPNPVNHFKTKSYMKDSKSYWPLGLILIGLLLLFAKARFCG